MRKLLVVLMVVICSGAAMAILPGDSGTGGNTGITDPDWNTGGPGGTGGITEQTCMQMQGTYCMDDCPYGIAGKDECERTCKGCKKTTSEPSNTHVVTIDDPTFTATCYNCNYNCNCEHNKYSYSCAEGYYGNPDGPSSTACKACPANATCYGGTDFSCNDGYYKNAAGTGCDMCPANATCYGGTDFSCNAGYYKNTAGTECVMCPNTSGNWKPVYSGTSDGDAESIKDCYISVGATFTDNIGTFEVVNEKCYHN